MTRSILSPGVRSMLFGLLGAASVAAIASVPLACQSGGVGDPCTPEDEYNPQFSGFKVTEENIESRSFQCETRICLVNHFQGRVSCPLGQETPVPCSSDGECNGDKCVEAPSLAPSCDPKAADKGASSCAGFGGTCNPTGKFCECSSPESCPQVGDIKFDCECQNTSCTTKVCKAHICHKEGSCQRDSASPEDNKGKACCVPGTDTPIAGPVCSQCAESTNRDAPDAVYCSCRCGVAEKEPPDPDFHFCDCPSGFSCEEIRKNVGLGDKQITGKYCIKEKTKYTSDVQCNKISGANPAGASCTGIQGI